MSLELLLAVIAVAFIFVHSLGFNKWFHWGWMGTAIAFALLLFSLE